MADEPVERIDTAEDYMRRTEANFIKLLTEGPTEAPYVPVPKHPNEVLTEQAVRDGVYTADEAGIPEPD